MYTKLNIKKIALSLALPLVMLSAPQAQAFDLKTWSGSMCSAFYGTQDQFFNRTHSGIKNISGDPRWVTCGVVDDTYNGSNSGNYDNGTQGARVRVQQPPASLSTCYLSERGDFGQEIDTTMVVIPGSGEQNLSTTASDHWGNRILLCKLAPGATLNRITIWEYDNSDQDH